MLRIARQKKKIEGKANYVEVIEDEKVLLMVQTPSTSGCDTVWYLDTGARNHMIGHKHLFAEMNGVSRNSFIRRRLQGRDERKRQHEISPKEWKTQNDRRCLLYFRDKEQHFKCVPTNGKKV
jgi:hypothetical protein